MIAAGAQFEQKRRWECECGALLARYEPGGMVEVKYRQMWVWVHSGKVTIQCLKCGKRHDGPPIR